MFDELGSVYIGYDFKKRLIYAGAFRYITMASSDFTLAYI